MGLALLVLGMTKNTILGSLIPLVGALFMTTCTEELISKRSYQYLSGHAPILLVGFGKKRTRKVCAREGNINWEVHNIIQEILIA